MDSNKENILKELTNFGKNLDEVEKIPEILEKYLNNVARSGDIMFKWEQFKPLIKKKIEIIANKFNEAHPYNSNLINQPNVKPFDFEEIKRNILNGIDSFTGAPFTIQRICELLIDPYRHYRRADKFMKGLEKNVMVISEETVDQRAENGNTNISCLNSTFTLPSTSFSTNLLNGYKENELENLSQHNSQQPSTLQQLDSFTTVFVSSSQSQNSLDRIANLPILEFTNTNSCLASSSSSITSISPNITITPIPDPALENSDKISTEQELLQLEERSNELNITNVNTGEQQLSSEKCDLQNTTCSENEGNNSNSINKEVNTDESQQQEKFLNSNDDVEIKETENLNEDLDKEPVKQVKNKDELSKNEETVVIDIIPIKKDDENTFKSPIKLNELKRTCDSPDAEPIKRLKSSSNEQEKIIEKGESIEFNQETTEENSEDKLNKQNLECNQQLVENKEEEKKLNIVNQKEELVNQPTINEQLTDNDLNEKISTPPIETTNLEQQQQIETELLVNDDNQQKDMPLTNESKALETQEESKKDSIDTN